MAAPSYFVPEGIPRPGHIRSQAPIFTLPEAGPGGLTGATYGRPYLPDEEYIQTGAGWWMHLDDVHARDLVRTNCLPGHRVGSWIVPAVLDGETCTIGYFGPEGFIVPEAYREIVDRLRATLDSVPGSTCTLEQASLAADVLAMNYHASLVELGYWQMLTPAAVWRILLAAVGIAPPEA